jgi:DNA-directed RNA polymerase specialized sigma24 family protein
VITQGRQVATDDTYLTETAFARLLRWLDDGEDSDGAGYMKMRQRLVAYFERRGRTGADALVDETFNRIGHTLETSGVIAVRPPARYCFVAARYVFLEDVRRARRSVSFIDGIERISVVAQREFRLECLERCSPACGPISASLRSSTTEARKASGSNGDASSHGGSASRSTHSASA